MFLWLSDLNSVINSFNASGPSSRIIFLNRTHLCRVLLVSRSSHPIDLLRGAELVPGLEFVIFRMHLLWIVCNLFLFLAPHLSQTVSQ